MVRSLGVGFLMEKRWVLLGFWWVLVGFSRVLNGKLNGTKGCFAMVLVGYYGEYYRVQRLPKKVFSRVF